MRALAAALLLLFAARQSQPRALRVCADPNNLPFSDSAGSGFENKIAELVARDLHASLAYTWWPQRRGFVKRTLGANDCDVVIGVPVGYDLVMTTRPYYRSGYVFLSRRDRGYALQSLDDPLLRGLKVGVSLIGSHYQNTPPGDALAERGIVANVVGIPVYGDYERQGARPEIIGAVARGEVDVAIVWGPTAGYWAKRDRVPLAIAPIISSGRDSARVPMRFDMAMGVRKKDDALRATLDSIIVHRQHEIGAILESYAVPRVP
ncbi:MAG: substrate-binding domain-containing protein [Gemmatimonadota bacterium]|nr:substrate-binding domain-containing protein [Gemmatimonadota bacterium]